MSYYAAIKDVKRDERFSFVERKPVQFANKVFIKDNECSFHLVGEGRYSRPIDFDHNAIVIAGV